MALFVVNKMIETAARKANGPRPEDFIGLPLYQTAREYIEPDYSPLHFIGVVGLCVVAFLFLSALKARYTCAACGHRWKP
jgi:hypothetical protein